jgi:hypothetical protein
MMTAREALEIVMDALSDDRAEIEKALGSWRSMSIEEAREYADVISAAAHSDDRMTPAEFKAERVAHMQGELEHNGDMQSLVRRILAKTDE